ncbi:Hypothetical predicted protein [Mytilus galloprovincialis]|uniref:BTB domain-containing protein n=1 Tax=Mytilus galloprovincialis TaxID=29158 RepID=A0A8B6HGM7_MYTGA|nr:Hypothetical predicted protein [Mytilus galloprovincialis]
MKYSFAKQHTTLIVDGEKLFINKAELIQKYPVFEKLFTADFKEKNAHAIELPGKNLQHFLKFLRCTLDGYKDDITDENVHIIIPLASIIGRFIVWNSNEKIAEQYTSSRWTTQ